MPRRVIVSAALRFTLPNGGHRVICGVRHFDQFMQPEVERLMEVEGCSKPEQGFVDNNYQFLDRRQALRVARMANQINQRRKKTSPAYLLFSEDLY
jgi:hypothetical protein